MTSGNENIRIAERADLPKIEQLLNSAYRGEASRAGWTTEADLIAGDQRTDLQTLVELWEKPGSIFLKYETSDEGMAGCVNLQRIDDKLYLGMFAVSPTMQGGGIGKKLLAASASYAKQQGAIAIFMSVVSVRTELIDWYLRYGYQNTGISKAFSEDQVSGRHLQPLEFIILEKKMV
jgi:ribosomal protein S18 acetylase RimI-like enzyme